MLLLLSISVERRAARVGLYGEGVTLKITYADMKSITRSRLIPSTRSAADIYEEAASLLDRIARKPVRLIGTGIYHLTDESVRQLRFDDYLPDIKKESAVEAGLKRLQQRYGLDFSGHLDQIFHGDTLYKTVEYMRRH